MTNHNDQLTYCPICQRALTLAPEHLGDRCTDPAHWQAAGHLSPHDYYPMAQLVASAGGGDNGQAISEQPASTPSISQDTTTGHMRYPSKMFERRRSTILHTLTSGV